jgi:hypothetical protein
MCAATASLSISIEDAQYSFGEMLTPTPILEETICDSGTDHGLSVIVCIMITFIVMALLINPWFIIGSCVMIFALMARGCTYTLTQDDSSHRSIILVSLYGERASL